MPGSASNAYAHTAGSGAETEFDMTITAVHAVVIDKMHGADKTHPVTSADAFRASCLCGYSSDWVEHDRGAAVAAGDEHVRTASTSATAPEPADHLLTADEVVERLELGEHGAFLLRMLDAAGRGPHGWTLGGRRVYRQATVDRWLARTEPRSEVAQLGVDLAEHADRLGVVLAAAGATR